jgi:hypothetical protein
MRDKTEVVCILDRSGSMENIIMDAIGGYNSFIETPITDTEGL